MDVLYNHMNHMGWIIADQGWYTCWLFSNPAPKQKQSEHAMKTPHLTKKVQQMSGSGEDPCVEPCVRISPSAIHHYNTCMWLTLWSDSFSPIWQSHHSLMLSNVSVSSTLVHHITMMCVTIMSLCKVLPTHHYNITRAQQFSTYMSRFWSKITKWSTDPKTKRWLHLNLVIIYQFLHQ